MRKILYTACALFCGIGGAMAQQQPQFSHYGFNGMYLSPAYAGINGSTEFTGIFRYQWAGYNANFGDKGGSPTTGLFTASVPWKKLKGGIGLTYAYDEIGPDQNQNLQLSYSYHLTLGSGKLGIGVQGGAFRLQKDGSKYRFIDPNDPNIFQGVANDTKFDLGAGLWYQADKWYVGGGVTNLLESEYSFKVTDAAGNPKTGEAILRKHGYLTGGVTIPVSVNVDVIPTAIVKYAPEALSYEVGARASFNDKFWVGAGYRGQEAITGLAGVGMLKDNSLRFGYAFDLTTFEKEAKGNTSHEVLLSYRIPASAFAPRPAIRTPRYSF